MSTEILMYCVVFFCGFIAGLLFCAYRTVEKQRIAKNKRIWAKARKEGRVSIGLSGRQIIIPPPPKIGETLHQLLNHLNQELKFYNSFFIVLKPSFWIFRFENFNN